MQRNQREITRRDLLCLSAGLPLAGSLLACSAGGTKKVGKAAPDTKVNKKVYWARREEWTGEDWVVCVVEVGDRLLMVQFNDERGWDFPGGIVKPYEHGEKKKDNDDLIKAATLYVHDQGLVPVLAGEAIVLAYGYVIDEYRHKVKMVHWVNVFSLSDFLPTPQANLKDVLDVRWVATDDPELGEILKRRLNQITEAGEGRTLVNEEI